MPHLRRLEALQFVLRRHRVSALRRPLDAFNVLISSNEGLVERFDLGRHLAEPRERRSRRRVEHDALERVRLLRPERRQQGLAHALPSCGKLGAVDGNFGNGAERGPEGVTPLCRLELSLESGQRVSLKGGLDLGDHCGNLPDQLLVGGGEVRTIRREHRGGAEGLGAEGTLLVAALRKRSGIVHSGRDPRLGALAERLEVRRHAAERVSVNVGDGLREKRLHPLHVKRRQGERTKACRRPHCLRLADRCEPLLGRGDRLVDVVLDWEGAEVVDAEALLVDGLQGGRLRPKLGVPCPNLLGKFDDAPSERHTLFADDQLVEVLSVVGGDLQPRVDVVVDEDVVEDDHLRQRPRPRAVLKPRRLGTTGARDDHLRRVSCAQPVAFDNRQRLSRREGS